MLLVERGMLFPCVLQQELIEKYIMQCLKKGLNYFAAYVFRLQMRFSHACCLIWRTKGYGL